MIKSSRFFLAILLSCFLLPANAFSEAQVIDDSDNFVILDEQRDPYERPIARAQVEEREEEHPLAYDTTERNKSNNAVLLEKIQGLQQEIQELRGQLEVQAHELKLLQQQQLSFYKDLDARVRQNPVEARKDAVKPPKENISDLSVTTHAKEEPVNKPAEMTSPVSSVNNTQKILPMAHVSRQNPADEQISYLAAYELVKNKKYDEALNAMQKFVAHYPQSGYNANAQYWLGELQLVKKNYPQAINHFETVLQQYPASSKTAASMLKIGYALAAAGKKNEAKKRLQEVIKNYPNTSTAELASAKLASLNI